jgi:hypothetical protein
VVGTGKQEGNERTMSGTIALTTVRVLVTAALSASVVGSGTWSWRYWSATPPGSRSLAVTGGAFILGPTVAALVLAVLLAPARSALGVRCRLVELMTWMWLGVAFSCPFGAIVALPSRWLDLPIEMHRNIVEAAAIISVVSGAAIGTTRGIRRFEG